MLTCWLDEKTGIIHIEASGEWTPAMLDAHYAEMRALLAERRAAKAPVMVLVDMREAAIPSPELREHIEIGTKQTYRPGDRLVMITADRDVLEDERARWSDMGFWTFCSPLAAEQWLLLDQHGD